MTPTVGSHSMMRNHDHRPLPASGRDRLMVLAAAILFSTGGAAVKACTLNGWQVACFRSAVAALAIFALIPAARRGWNRAEPGGGVSPTPPR